MADDMSMDEMETVLQEGAVHPEIVKAMEEEADQASDTKPKSNEGAAASNDQAVFHFGGKDYADEDAALDDLVARYPQAPVSQTPVAPVQPPAVIPPAPASAYDDYSTETDQGVQKVVVEARQINEESRQLLLQNKELSKQLSDEAIKKQFWSEFYDRYKDLKKHTVVVSGMVEKYRSKITNLPEYTAQQFLAQATRTYLKRLNRLAPTKSETVTQQTSAQIPKGTSPSGTESATTASVNKKTEEKFPTLHELMKKEQREMKAAYNPARAVNQQVS